MKFRYGQQTVTRHENSDYYDEYFKEVDQQEFEKSLSGKKQQEFRAYIKTMSLVGSNDITLTLLQYRPVRALYHAGRLIKFEKMPGYTETKICLARIEACGSYKQYEYMIPQFMDQLYMSDGTFEIDTLSLKLEQFKPIELVNAGQEEVGFFGYGTCDVRADNFKLLKDDEYKYSNIVRTLDLKGLTIKDIGYDFQKLGKYWRVYMPQGLVDTALTNNKKINLGNCQIGSENGNGIVLETIDIDKIINGQSLFGDSDEQVINIPSNYNTSDIKDGCYKDYEIYGTNQNGIVVLDINKLGLKNIQNAKRMFNGCTIKAGGFKPDPECNSLGTRLIVGYWDIQHYKNINLERCFGGLWEFSELYLNLGNMQDRNINITGLIDGNIKEVEIRADNMSEQQVVRMLACLSYNEHRYKRGQHTLNFRHMRISNLDISNTCSGSDADIERQIRSIYNTVGRNGDYMIRNKIDILVSKGFGWTENFLNGLRSLGFCRDWYYYIDK